MRSNTGYGCAQLQRYAEEDASERNRYMNRNKSQPLVKLPVNLHHLQQKNRSRLWYIVVPE
jgi:hypothetical protein